MPRQALQKLKKAVRAGTSPLASQDDHEQAVQAALALLERSVRMRHRRLAVQRLNEAVALGAQITDEHWTYCRQAAEASRDEAVQALFTQSAQAACTRTHRPGGPHHG
jgi:hypothetical protein